MAGGVLLRISNLTKFYGNKLVLNGINMDINQGEIFGIVGMSGAGKTTFLECLVGFTQYDQGDILVALHSDWGDSFISTRRQKDMKRKFGFASQCPSFYSKLTIMENLEYFGSLYGMDKSRIRHNANILINLVGLSGESDTLAGNLSGGMQKRLDIACALIHGPRVLILDEPTADLDPISRRNMMDVIKKINSEGTTVIIASHIFEEVEHMCNRISIIHNHDLKTVGDIHTLKKHFNARNLEQVFEAIVR